MNKLSKVNQLSGGSQYTRLLARARELMALDKRLQELLPAPLNAHCSTLAVSDTTLMLAADSPVWAARLRFHTSHLAKQLADHPRLNIQTVRIKVRPVKPAPPNKRHALPGLTSQAAATIKQAARSISDPALKAGLLKLARRHTPR